MKSMGSFFLGGGGYCRDDVISLGKTTCLESNRVHLKTLLSEHKLGTLIGKFKEALNLLPKKLEGPIALVPAQNNDTKCDLETKTP